MTFYKWLFYLCYLISFIFCSYLAFGDPVLGPINVGRAPYAIMSKNFDCKAFLKSLKGVPEWHISFLWGTFGDAHACLNKVLKSPKLKSIHVSLMNERCLFNRNCESREILFHVEPSEYLTKVTKNNFKFVMKLHQYQSKFKDYLFPRLRDGVDCYISPALESSLPPKGAKNILDISRSLFAPRCKIVWNPLPSSPHKKLYGADLVEYHGPQPSPKKYPCLSNLDGWNINFKARPITGKKIDEEDIPTYVLNNAHCDVVYLWMGEDNCRTVGNWTPPTQRACPGHVYKLATKYLTLPY